VKTLLQLLIVVSGLLCAAHAADYRLVASGSAANDAFGQALAATRDLVVVGAPGATANGAAGAGAAYVFARDDCRLREIARLVATDGAAGDAFGTTVAIADGVIVVAAPNAAFNAQPGHGAVYVFEQRDGNWTQVATLGSTDTLADAGYGSAVATDGRTVLVGAPRAHGRFGPPGAYQVGAVYAYEREQGEWRQQDKFFSPRETLGAQFGAALAMDDSRALVAQPAARDHSGEVFAFERDDGEWDDEQRLAPGDGIASAARGAALAMDGERFALGAPGGETDDTFLSGVVYVYDWRRGDPDLDDALAPQAWETGEAFGTTLALAGERLAAATRAGRVHVFERRGRRWQETGIHAVPAGAGAYGAALAWSENLLLVGAPATSMGGNVEQGAVYVLMLRD